ncbi:MAG TPA: hypothetical protein VGO60_04010, partial [Iamia sp.]|nr:hypothetical protein [Iamia sp.]
QEVVADQPTTRDLLGREDTLTSYRVGVPDDAVEAQVRERTEELDGVRSVETQAAGGARGCD